MLELVGEKFKSAVNVISKEADFPGTSIVIGNTSTEADLDSWVQRLDADTIPAGSSGFFNAILNRVLNGNPKLQEELVLGKRILFVCGSAFPMSKTYVRQAHIDGRYVSYMPDKIFCSNSDREEMLATWIADIIKALRECGNVIIAVDRLLCDDAPDLPVQIRTMMAAVIEGVMQLLPLDELVIEGGATASTIIDRLNYKRFSPSQELAQGVIRMKVQENQGLYITMKPGSYHWPASIWSQPIQLDKIAVQ